MSRMAHVLTSLILLAHGAFANAESSSPSPAPQPQVPLATKSNSKENPQEILPNPTTKRDVIAKLKTIQSKQSTLINEIDQKVKSKLKETQEVKVTDDTAATEIRISKLQETMQDLETRRREAIERSQFIDRLIFAVDTKWTQNSLKIFLEQTLLDIAAVEMNQSVDTKPSNIWKFATYLSVAIRELPEPREELTSFIDNYMEFSTVSNPKPPTAFAQARSYTNGISSQAAKTVRTEDVGDGVERKLKQLGVAEKNESGPAVVQGTTSAPPVEPTGSPPPAPQPTTVP